MEEQEYIDTPTLSKLSGVPCRTIRADIKLGILPAEKRADRRGVRWGGCWFIRTDNAQKYINTRRTRVGISVRELNRRIGKVNRIVLAEAIKNGELPAFKLANRKTSPWCILEEDAYAFSQRMGWTYVVAESQSDSHEKDQSNGHEQIATSEERELDVIHRCGSCGTTRGNILGDVDKTTEQKYGFLCMKCYHLVRGYENDVPRLRHVLTYLEKTRVNPYNKKMPSATTT